MKTKFENNWIDKTLEILENKVWEKPDYESYLVTTCYELRKKQLKEFGDKLSADKKAPIEIALEDLKKAYESKDLAQIDTAMDKINEAWKAASEEMYAAQQANAGGANTNANQGASNANQGDSVEDVDFEEVK